MGKQEEARKAVGTIVTRIVVGGFVCFSIFLIASQVISSNERVRLERQEAQIQRQRERDRQDSAALEIQNAQKRQEAAEVRRQTTFAELEAQKLKTEAARLQERDRVERDALTAIHKDFNTQQPIMFSVPIAGKDLASFLRGRHRDDLVLLTRLPADERGKSDYELKDASGECLLSEQVDFSADNSSSISLRSKRDTPNSSRWSNVVIDFTTKTFSADYEAVNGESGIKILPLGQDNYTEAQIATESPAAKAGITTGDRIVAVDGKPTREIPAETLYSIFQGIPRETFRLATIARQPRIRYVNRISVPDRDYGVLGFTPALDADGSLVVEHVAAHSPADEALIVPNDIIDSINGEKTMGMTMDSIVEKLAGPAGKVVMLGVRHYSELDVTLVDGRQIQQHVTSHIASVDLVTAEQFASKTAREPKATPTPTVQRPPLEIVRAKTTLPPSPPVDAEPASVPPARMNNAEPDPAAVEKFVREFFDSVSSLGRTTRPWNYFAAQAFFYGEVTSISEIERRFVSSEDGNAFRYISVGTIKVAPQGNGIFNVFCTAEYRLGKTAGSARVIPDQRYYSRIETGTGLNHLAITRFGEEVFPGWTVAKYRTRISGLDLRQSGSKGKAFSALRWHSEEELVREILLQDRYNYETGITADPEDSAEDYFSPGNRSRVEDCKKIIAKRRDEWAAKNMHVRFVGSLDSLLTGTAIIQVQITERESILVQINP